MGVRGVRAPWRVSRVMAAAVVALLFASVLAAISADPADGQAGANCFGRLVTVDLSLGQVPTDGDDVILGTPNDDSIAGGDGDDVICGEGGNDTIWGQNGNDIIFGGPGDDRLRGGNGNDWVLGESGSDDLNGGRDNDTVLGGDDDDPAVRGGTGDDVVYGGRGNDAKVAGNGGSDKVAGGPGDDVVTGGPRPDEVWGGPGNDTINGNKGADSVWGNEGDDDLRGGPQPDAIHGGDGFDECNGGSESDTHTACESLTLLEELNLGGVDRDAPLPTLPPGLSPGVVRPLSLGGDDTSLISRWGQQLETGEATATNPVGTAQIQMQLPALFERVVNLPRGEGIVASVTVVPDAADGQLTVSVLRDVGAERIDEVLSATARTLMIADGCVASTSQQPLDLPAGLTAAADAISAAELTGSYAWFDSCNAPEGGFWSAVAIVVSYPGVGLVEILGVGTTQAELFAAELALATLEISAPSVEFSQLFDPPLPAAGATNVFGRADFPTAAMSLELPDRFSLRAESIEGFFAINEDTDASLAVARFPGDADLLDQRAVMSYDSLAIGDSCDPIAGNRQVEFVFSADPGDVFFVEVNDVATPLGPGVAVTYSGCTLNGIAAVQVAVARGDDALLFTVVAADAADVEAFDRLFDTLIIG